MYFPWCLSLSSSQYMIHCPWVRSPVACFLILCSAVPWASSPCQCPAVEMTSVSAMSQYSCHLLSECSFMMVLTSALLNGVCIANISCFIERFATLSTVSFLNTDWILDSADKLWLWQYFGSDYCLPPSVAPVKLLFILTDNLLFFLLTASS